MNVRELTQEQLYELKDKVFYMNQNYLEEETVLWNSLREAWDDNIQVELENACHPGMISNETIYKLFDGINFVNDDFCCSCGED